MSNVNNSDILLCDWLLRNDIWGAIKKIEPFPFIQSVPILTMQTNIEGGQRVVYSVIGDYPVDDIAQMIVSRCGDYWNSVIMMPDVDIDSSNTTRTSNDYTKNNTSTGDIETINKVGSFNSTDLVNDTGTSNNNTDAGLETMKGNVSVAQSSYKNLYENLNYARKTNIIKLSVSDVIKSLTLSIY